MYYFLQKRSLMPNIDQKIATLKEQLNPGIKSILPSRGIPSASGGTPSSLTTWTELQIYDKGAQRKGGTRVVGSSGGASATWVLPLPQDLTDMHSMQYETIEFGALAIATGKLTDMMTAESGAIAQELEKGYGPGASSTLGNISRVAGEEVLGYFGLEQAINVIRARTRNTVNPNMENLFKTPNLRTFQFSWTLTPLSSSDSGSIKDFVSIMKTKMYPTNSTVLYGWNRLDYPAEFVLNFYSSGLTSGKQKIFSTAACACTDLTIGYTPNGAFHTHTDGRPTTVTINGTFQELYTLDSNEIKDL